MDSVGLEEVFVEEFSELTGPVVGPGGWEPGEATQVRACGWCCVRGECCLTAAHPEQGWAHRRVRKCPGNFSPCCH